MSRAEYQRRRRAEAAKAEGREPGRRGRPPSAPHGTVAAYKRHRTADEPPCDPCREAWNAYQRDLYHRRRGDR